MPSTMTLQKAIEMIQKLDTLEENKKLILGLIPFMKAGGNGRHANVDKTVIRHLYCYRKLMEYWNPKRNLIKATRQDIILLMAKIESQPLSEGTKAKIRLIIKMVFKHYKGSDEFYPPQISWIRTTDRSEMSVTPADLITRQELNKLISSTLNLRDSAVLALLSEGLRPHELLALRKKDIDLNSEPCHVYIPIGTKHGRRTEPLLFSVPYLGRYFDAVPDLGPDDPAFLYNLTDKSKGGMTYPALRSMLAKVAKRAGIPSSRRLYLYLFRHTAITRDAGSYSASITAKKNGTSTRMLEKHYVHLTFSDVDDAFMKKNGLKKKDEEEQPTIRPCLKCNYINSLEQKFCGRCGAALTKETATQQLRDKEDLQELFVAFMQNKDAIKKQLEMLKAKDREEG